MVVEIRCKTCQKVDLPWPVTSFCSYYIVSHSFVPSSTTNFMLRGVLILTQCNMFKNFPLLMPVRMSWIHFHLSCINCSRFSRKWMPFALIIHQAAQLKKFCSLKTFESPEENKVFGILRLSIQRLT